MAHQFRLASLLTPAVIVISTVHLDTPHYVVHYARIFSTFGKYTARKHRIREGRADAEASLISWKL